MESFVSGWKDALIIAGQLDKVIATDTLPPCVLCNGAEGRKYRFPDAHSANHLSNAKISLQDPTRRASGLTVLNGMLGDLVITMSLGSQMGGEPVEACGDGYAEADHPGSENG